MPGQPSRIHEGGRESEFRVQRMSGRRRKRKPDSVTVTSAACYKSSTQCSITRVSKSASSSARRPSIRTRMTEGLAAPVSASWA